MMIFWLVEHQLTLIDKYQQYFFSQYGAGNAYSGGNIPLPDKGSAKQLILALLVGNHDFGSVRRQGKSTNRFFSGL